MLRFSLFGFPISVHWMFWLVVAMLRGGGSASSPEDFQQLLLWVAAAFVSILIHELGHAFLQRRFGGRPQILLYAFGGLAMANRGFSRGRDIMVSLAGPAVQILCGLAMKQLLNHSTGDAWQVKVFLLSFYQVSIFWGLFNLVPIFPLDGGHVLRSWLGPEGRKSPISWVWPVPSSWDSTCSWYGRVCGIPYSSPCSRGRTFSAIRERRHLPSCVPDTSATYHS